MELRHLRYFLTAAEEQNFTRAAARLNVTVPALSRRIADLEREIGVALFDRLRQRVYLTKAGEVFAEEVRGALDRLTRGQERARAVADRDASVLRVGINGPIMRHKIIGSAISQFSSVSPAGRLKVEVISTEQLVAALKFGDIDAGFLHRADLGDDGGLFDRIEIARDHYVLLLPETHPLVDRPSIALRDLADEPFIWFPRDIAPAMHGELSAACEHGGLTPRIVQSASSIPRIELVAAGAGLAFILAPLWEPWPANVIARTVEDLNLPQPLDFVWPRDRESPALAQLRNILLGMRSE